MHPYAPTAPTTTRMLRVRARASDKQCHDIDIIVGTNEFEALGVADSDIERKHPPHPPHTQERQPKREGDICIDIVAVSGNFLRGRVNGNAQTTRWNEVLSAQVMWPKEALGPYSITCYAKSSCYGREEARIFSSSIVVP